MHVPRNLARVVNAMRYNTLMARPTEADDQAAAGVPAAAPASSRLDAITESAIMVTIKGAGIDAFS